MISASSVVGVLIGGIVGAAVVAWRHARTDAPPAPSVGISCVGLGNGKGGIYPDPYYARLIKLIFDKMAMEVRL
jgi:hypothetical protein